MIISYLDVTSIENIEELIRSFPKKRIEYINSISFPKRRAQSICVWALFERALSKLFLDGKSFEFDVDKNGKWFEKNNAFYFSLSHSKNIVCVAISLEGPIAIDVESCDDKLLGVEKLFPTIEKNQEGKIKLLAKEWTKRECSIKENKLKLYNSFFVNDSKNYEYCITVSSNVSKVLKSEIIKLNIE